MLRQIANAYYKYLFWLRSGNFDQNLERKVEEVLGDLQPINNFGPHSKFGGWYYLCKAFAANGLDFQKINLEKKKDQIYLYLKTSMSQKPCFLTIKVG
jgi:ABC-type sulfate transport system substrate-binding protein